MLRSALVSSLVAAVSAHQNFHQFWVNDVSPGYQVAIRMPPSNSPVTDVTSDDIACNVNGSITPSGVETYAASEGDKITVNWDISSHPGPITHFLFGPVDDASQTSGVGAGWFKIDELDYQNGTWANEVVGNNGGNYTFNLPSGLESGEYLLRSEMLALHGAQTVGGGQFYIGCAQLKITGTGGGCSPSIALPGAYNAEDDNIYIPNVYNGFDPTTYSAPGGSVAVCGGSGSTPATTTETVQSSSSAAATPTSAANTTVTPISSIQAVSSLPPASTSASTAQSINAPTTFATITSASARPTSTGTSANTVAIYSQCGGTGYTGATLCASGSTCKVQNDYYHQCVAA